MIENKNISRRTLLGGIGLAAVGATTAAVLGGCDSQANSSSIARGDEAMTYADTIAWDGEYDVVVLGFGCAGASAAYFAAKSGAKVLLADSAPYGEQGGNSKVCHQLYAKADTKQNGYDYYDALNGGHALDESMLDWWAQEISKVEDTLTELGCDPSLYHSMSDVAAWINNCPEFPELPGSEGITINSANGGATMDAYLYNTYCASVQSMRDSIDIALETPGVELIAEPVANTVLGVVVEREGKRLNIRAKNGVVIATGGFENNRQMLEDYLYLSDSRYVGTAYNMGAGIIMAANIGADLWHMNSYENLGPSLKSKDGRSWHTGVKLRVLHTGSVDLFAKNGERIYNLPLFNGRHGKYPKYGAWYNPQWPTEMYYVFDKKKYDEVIANENFKGYEDQVITAPTIRELAEAAGMDPDGLERGLADWHRFIEEGYDPVLGRDVSTMEPFDDGPYYAIPGTPSVLNTQGGPRRNSNSEILDKDGNPIPHLYGAGECGGIAVFMYQGGGNMSECAISGKAAGTNAAAQKDDLPAYVGERVQSNLIYVPGTIYDLQAESVDIDLGEHEYLGTAEGKNGEISLKCTIESGVITACEVVQQYETENIGTKAIDVMPEQFVGLKTADEVMEIDTVSGATITADALKAAAVSCLEQAK